MNLCGLDELKDWPDAETYLLPSTQKDMFKDWCKANNKLAVIQLKVPGVKEPFTIKLD
jgi:hypothetical protein